MSRATKKTLVEVTRRRIIERHTDMTTPSPAAVRAAELANDYTGPDRYEKALVKHLDYVSMAAKAIDDALGMFASFAIDGPIHTKLRALILPEPVDEFAQAVRDGLPRSQADAAAVAIARNLRAAVAKAKGQP